MAPIGLWLYRTALYGGMSSEVTCLFNKSHLMARLMGIKFACWAHLSFFHLFGMQLMASFREGACQKGSRLGLPTQRTIVCQKSGKTGSTCPRSSVRMATTCRCVTAVLSGWQ
jgi:hypothetical protein